MNVLNFPQRGRRTSRYFLLICLVGAGLGNPAIALGEDKPIALVTGTGYGRSEVQSLLQHVFQDDLGGLTAENCGEFLAVEDFDRFSMVILAGSKDEPYTPEESAQIDDYVQKGGRILLINQAPKNLSVAGPDADRDSSYLFGRSYYLRNSVDSQVLQPDHPLLEGVFDETPNPFWLNGNVLLRSQEWESLIGTEDLILVGTRKLGEGSAYYVGTELFRVYSNARRGGVEHEMEGWVRILRNMIMDDGKKP
jgi:hypothetical protein